MQSKKKSSCKTVSGITIQMLTPFRLGRSAEQALFGGMVISIINDRQGDPHLGFFAMTFPQKAVQVNARNNPMITTEGFAIPIPVTFYENICSQTYLDVHVKKFGISGALKVPGFISASVSSLKRNVTSNGYPWEWHVLKENDVNLRQELEAASVKSLSAMTPEQRKEHAELTRRDMVADFHALLAKRDDLVEQTISAGVFTMKIDQKDPNYAYGTRPLLDLLGELFELQCKIISHVPKVEAAADNRCKR